MSETSDHNPPEPAVDEALAMIDELERLRAELAESKDRVLRTQAELENFRKRVRREIEEEQRYANLPLLRDLLPVIDNMGRAILDTEARLRAAEEKGSGDGPLFSSTVAGLKIVVESLQGTLAKYGCKKIPALHEPFDPHKHQAISQQATSEFPPGTVLIVAQDGYQLHDRILRPAQVIVSTAAVQP